MTYANDGTYTDLFPALVSCQLTLNPNAVTRLETSAKDRFGGKENDSGVAVLGIGQTSSLTHRNGSGRQCTFSEYVASEWNARSGARTRHQRPHGDDFGGHGCGRQDRKQCGGNPPWFVDCSRSHRPAFRGCIRHLPYSNIGGDSRPIHSSPQINADGSAAFSRQPAKANVSPLNEPSDNS